MSEIKRETGVGGWQNFYPCFRRPQSVQIWESQLQVVGDALFASGGQNFNLKHELRHAGETCGEWVWIRSDGQVFNWDDVKSKLTLRELACWDNQADSYFRSAWEQRLKLMNNLRI